MFHPIGFAKELVDLSMVIDTPLGYDPFVETAPSLPIQLNVGVIGAGGRISTVLKNVRRHAPGIRIVALCDPDANAIDKARNELEAGDAVVCATPEELCSREDVDWVFIGSWNCLHAEHTETAFLGGKHVFCEKPLALTLSEAERMHTSWLKADRIFAIGLVLRYSPLYREVHRLLQSGRLGRLLSFEFNETLEFNHGGYIHGNWRRFTQNAGSHLLEKCCHDLDLALWLVGARPTRVASFGGCSFFTPENIGEQHRIGPSPAGGLAFEGWKDAHNVNPFTSEKNIVDHQVAILEFTNGVHASFHTHCMAGLPERRFYLIGSEGSLRVDAYTGRIELKRVGWNEHVEIIEPTQGDGHAGADDPMARELAECMAGLRLPSAGFFEGLQSLVVAEAMDSAMRKGQVFDLKPLWTRADQLRWRPSRTPYEE